MINSSHFSNKTRRNHRTPEDDPVANSRQARQEKLLAHDLKLTRALPARQLAVRRRRNTAVLRH